MKTPHEVKQFLVVTCEISLDEFETYAMPLRMSTAISDALRAIEVCASTWHDNLFRYFIWEV